MKLLVTGRGTSGSWQIRGVQLGQAIGATVQPAALNVAGYDAAVLVKRPSPGLVERLHRARVPIVWDIVDAYPQPAAFGWSRDQCMAWLRAQVAEIKPVALVAATEAMATDCAWLGLPVLALPHHSRPAQALNAIHPEVRRIGYEGADHYLGRWLPLLEAECAHRGWRFIVNPPRLADLDIVVCLRDSESYAAMRWKSGVKTANAIGSGTPAITGREAGCREIAPPLTPSCWEYRDLANMFDRLEPRKTRQALASSYQSAAPALALPALAAVYREWLEGLPL